VELLADKQLNQQTNAPDITSPLWGNSHNKGQHTNYHNIIFMTHE